MTDSIHNSRSPSPYLSVDEEDPPKTKTPPQPPAGRWFGGLFSGIVPDVQGRVKAWAGEAAEQATIRAAQVLKNSSKDACRSLEQLRECLNEACRKQEQGQPTDLGPIYTHIRSLLNAPATYLKEHRLTEEQQRVLSAFLEQESPADVILAYDIINQLYLEQLGELSAQFVVILDKFRRMVIDRHLSQQAAPPVESVNPEVVLNVFFKEGPSAPSSPTNSPENLKLEILQQAELSIKNISQFLLAKIFLSKAGTDPLVFVQTAQGTDFKKTLFEALNAPGFSFIDRWIARLFYPLTSLIVHFYIDHFVKNVLSFLEKQVENASKDNFQSLIQSCVHILHSELAKINGAYASVASQHTQVCGTVDEMVEASLQNPALNGGLSSQAINSAFANACIDRFMPLFQWSQRTRELLRFNDSSPFAILNGLLWIMGWIPRMGLYPLQTLLNSIAKRKAKKLFYDHDIVQMLRNSSREALLGKTYAHTVDQLCIDLLTHAKRSLSQNSYSSDPMNSLSDRTSRELAGLLNNLLQALHLHTISNTAELDLSIKSDAFPERFLRQAKPLIIDRVVSSLSPDIKTVLHTLFNESQLFSLIATSVANVNNSVFANKAAPTEEVQKQMEAKMKQLLEEIVELMINNAIASQLKRTEELQQIVDAQLTALSQASDREALRAIRDRVRKAPLMPEATVKLFEERIASRIRQQPIDTTKIVVPEPMILALLRRFQGSLSTGAIELAKTEAQEIPRLLKEPFFLRTMVSRMLRWFTIGQVT